MVSVRDQIRNLLGIRRERAVPRRTVRPALGARIARDDVRMVVQAGLTPELWSWLMEQGFREIRFRPDRRVYRDVPSSLVTALIDAAPDRRPKALDAALHAARRVGTPSGRPNA